MIGQDIGDVEGPSVWSPHVCLILARDPKANNVYQMRAEPLRGALRLRMIITCLLSPCGGSMDSSVHLMENPKGKVYRRIVWTHGWVEPGDKRMMVIIIHLSTAPSSHGELLLTPIAIKVAQIITSVVCVAKV